MKTSLWHSIRP